MAALVEKSEEEKVLAQALAEKAQVGDNQASNTNEEEDGDDDDEEEDGDDKAGGEGGDKKKKKKRKNKKKPAKKKTGAESGAVDNTKYDESLTCSRLLGGKRDYFIKYGQTFPPTIPVSELKFPGGKFPEGEIQPHGKTKIPNPNSAWARITEEEKR